MRPHFALPVSDAGSGVPLDRRCPDDGFRAHPETNSRHLPSNSKVVSGPKWTRKDSHGPTDTILTSHSADLGLSLPPNGLKNHRSVSDRSIRFERLGFPPAYRNSEVRKEPPTAFEPERRSVSFTRRFSLLDPYSPHRDTLGQTVAKSGSSCVCRWPHVDSIIPQFFSPVRRRLGGSQKHRNADALYGLKLVARHPTLVRST